VVRTKPPFAPEVSCTGHGYVSRENWMCNSFDFWTSWSRCLNTLRPALLVLVACVSGLIFSWLPVAALCSFPGVRYSNACGHNAVYWFILALPLGFILAAILAIRIYARGRKHGQKR